MPLIVLASVVVIAAAHATPVATPRHAEPFPATVAGPAPHDSVPLVRAVRAEHPPRIDGKDDDAVWRLAPVYGDFREFEPHEGTPARFRTEFKVAYDDRNLYVFVRAYDPHPDSIMHALSRHDIRGPSDQLKIIVDAYHDRRSGFEFAVNPDGVRREFAITGDANEDESWNGVWEVGTSVDSLGWTAEFRVPLSQLRFADKKEHVWGFGIWRDIERFKERVSWPLYRESKNGFVSQLGDLGGIVDLPSKHNLEVTPYAVAKNLSRTQSVGFARVQQETFGGDLKFGVTSNLSLDATVNPDFGQVEADPAVLNLSAFESFFPEKRPFFIEGSGLYQFNINCSIVNCNGEGLFYSRRIGRTPQLMGLYGDPSSPTSTPITAAAKLTGRLGNGLSVGVLDAVTPGVPGVGQGTIEPFTNYVVVRAQQDLHNGLSGIGLIGTAVDRSLDVFTMNALRRSAYVGGADFRHRFNSGNYEMTGSVTGSRVEGSAPTIAATQLDAVHYYQRPDGALRFDSTRTSLGGDAEEFTIGKFGGGVTRFQTSYSRQSPGYEVNDLGFQLRADQQSWNTWAALSFRQPRWFFKSAQFNVNETSQWTSAGLPLGNFLNTNWHVTMPNNWTAHLGASANNLGEVYCDRCTRGGPAVRITQGWYPWFGFYGDDRRTVIPQLFFNFGNRDGGRSHSLNVNGGADLHFSTRMLVSLNFNSSSNVDNGQWYGNFTDSANVTHYTFAHLNQRTISLTTRFTYTATPDLTLEFYGQPFVTTGEYSNVRQLSATPRAADYDARFAAFTPPAGSSTGFAFRQLRSNTVVRWEYRPGSTLFVVWQHGRQDFSGAADNRPWSAEYNDLFALHPDNTFLVKCAYWLNR